MPIRATDNFFDFENSPEFAAGDLLAQQARPPDPFLPDPDFLNPQISQPPPPRELNPITQRVGELLPFSPERGVETLEPLAGGVFSQIKAGGGDPFSQAKRLGGTLLDEVQVPGDFVNEVAADVAPLALRAIPGIGSSPQNPNRGLIDVAERVQEEIPDPFRFGTFDLEPIPTAGESLDMTVRDFLDPAQAVQDFRGRPTSQQIATGFINPADPFNAADIAFLSRTAGKVIPEVVDAAGNLKPAARRVGEVLSREEGQVALPPNPFASVRPRTPAALGKTVEDIEDLADASLTRSEKVINLFRDNRVMNAVLDPARFRFVDDPVGTRATTLRARGKKSVRSAAAVATEKAKSFVRTIGVDPENRITSLPDRPTLRDVAYDLSNYEEFLSVKQVEAIRGLSELLEPFRKGATIQGVGPGITPNVKPGGVYLPRGNVTDLGEEQVELASRRGSGRGGDTSSENPQRLETESDGILRGFKYPRVEDTVGGYIRHWGDKMVDAQIADQLKPFGKTLLERMDDDVVDAMQNLRGNLVDIKNSTGIPDEAFLGIREFLAIPAADLTRNNIDDLLRVMPGQDSLGRPFAELQRKVNAATSQAESVGPAWQRGLLKANEDRTLDSIQIQGLSDRQFPANIANAVNKVVESEKVSTGGDALPLRMFNHLNGQWRGLKATGDLSFQFIQGLLVAPQDIRAYGLANALALKSLLRSTAAGDFFRSFDLKAEQAGRLLNGEVRTSDEIAKYVHVGGVDTEFTQGISGAIPVFKQANRAFGTFGDTARVTLFEHALQDADRLGRVLSEEDLVKLGQSINRLTGYTDKRFGGAIGDALLFAPRFFQSQLELLVSGTKGLSPGRATIDDAYARQAILRSVGVYAGITVMFNEMAGRPIPVEELYDPRSSNFMRIRHEGRDYSLFGTWDSLVRGVVASARGVDDFKEGDIQTGLGDSLYLARTKSSPIVSKAIDLLGGKTFTGADPYSWQEMVKSFMPFAEAEMWDDRDILDPSRLLDVGGQKNAPMTPFEQSDQAVREHFEDTKWGRISLMDATELAKNDSEFRAEFEAYKRSPEGQELDEKQFEAALARGSAGALTRQKHEETKAVYKAQQESDDGLLLSGQMTPKEWREFRNERQDKLEGAREVIFDDLDEEDLTRLGQYWEAVDSSKDAGGRADYDKVDAWLGQQDSETQKLVANLVRTGTDLEVKYYQARGDLEESGFFGMYDAAWDAASRGTPAFQGWESEEAWREQAVQDVMGALKQQQPNVAPGVLRDQAKQFVSNSPEIRGLSKYRNSVIETEWINNNPEAFKLAVDWGYMDFRTLTKAQEEHYIALTALLGN